MIDRIRVILSEVGKIEKDKKCAVYLKREITTWGASVEEIRTYFA
jgi:hypothetical protein